MTIPQTALIVASSFGEQISAADVGHAIAQGLVAGGQPQPDLCPLEDVAALLAGMDFDARMRRARAVVLAQWRLSEDTLRRSAAFEVATRARQSGVPAYAVTQINELAPFDARILDLQLILEAPTRRALESAGTRLAQIV